MKKCNRKGIIVLSFLLLNILIVGFSMNQNFSDSRKESKKEGELKLENLKTNDLSSDNSFTGVGSPWNVTHYANYTKSGLGVDFNNNSYDDTNAKIELEDGWNGYQLNSTINNLYETRNWVNGTFHAGPDDNDGSYDDDDSEYLSNWTFHVDDVGPDNNPMSGNYYDVNAGESDGQDCLEMRIHDDLSNDGHYDVGDKCWWDTSIQMERGEVEEAKLSFAARAYSTDDFNNHMVLQVIVNGKILWGNGLASMLEASGNPPQGSWGQWYNPTTIVLDVNDEDLFPSGTKNLNITFEFKRVSGSVDSYDEYYTVLFDNVSLITKAKAKPSQLALKLNNELVDDDANYGEGSLGITGEWNGSIQSSVIANFSSDLNWPLTFLENNEWISNKIELDANLNLFANKFSPETYYTADPVAENQGSSFLTSNNSITDWTSYVHMEVPTGYEETNITVEYPSDYNLTGLFFSQNPNSLSQTTITEYELKKIVNIPASSITSNTNGFWKLEAVSPNYCKNMSIYNNATTGDWELNNTFLSGEYINITGIINDSKIVSNYLSQTRAQLQIRFPNGTIWFEQNQLKQVDGNGRVYFDPIQIPNSIPNYEAGEYEAIITWNNSYSNYGLNETGVIYKTFTVIHDSVLDPDTDNFENIFIGDTINLRISFLDSKDGSAITDANVSTVNFTDGIEQFSEIDPGYYFLEFNTTGGNPGDNSITITAEHPIYETTTYIISISLIVQTSLTAEEYPSLKVPWNNNFTIHYNYTSQSDGTGIENADLTIDWNQNMDYKIEETNGLYNLTLNSSLYEVNKVHNLKVIFSGTGFESQTIIIPIEVLPRATSIDKIFLNNKLDPDKEISVSYGEFIDINVTYLDIDSNQNITEASVSLWNGSILLGEFDKTTNEMYNYTLDTSVFSDIGTKFITVIAELDNHTSASEPLRINVGVRDTEYEFYFNGTKMEGTPPYSVDVLDNQLIHISLEYNETSGNLITGEDVRVSINGSTVSRKLEEVSGVNYTTIIPINTSDLNYGSNIFTIYAENPGYEPQSFTLIIQVVQESTRMNFYVNGTNMTTEANSKSILELDPLQINEAYNLTLTYLYRTNLAVTGANVNLTGVSYSENLEYNQHEYGNYSLILNSSNENLDWGINYLTLTARKEKFEPHTITLGLLIVVEATNLNFSVDGQNINLDSIAGISIKKYWNEEINLNVKYLDSDDKFIKSADVSLNGSGISSIFNENSDDYVLTLNSASLNLGFNYLNIDVEKNKYESQTIAISIQVLERETEIQIFLNGVNKTLDNYLEIPISSPLNITVKFIDSKSRGNIDRSTLELVGEGYSEEINKSQNYDQYTIMINTDDLDVGVRFLTISAQKDNYEPLSTSLRINVKRILTEIQLINYNSTALSFTPGQNVPLKISLKDLDFNRTITNATVRYTWELGQGTITDEDNDGIYEATLTDVPEGTYTITITVFAGDNYDFERIRITLSVNRPPTETFLYQVLTIVGIASAIGIGGYLVAYQRVLRYPQPVRKIHKYKKNLTKTSSLGVSIRSRDEILKELYKDELEPLEREMKGSMKDKLKKSPETPENQE